MGMGFKDVDYVLYAVAVATDGGRGEVRNLDDFVLTRLDFLEWLQEFFLDHFERVLDFLAGCVDNFRLCLECISNLLALDLDGGLEASNLAAQRLALACAFLCGRVCDETASNELYLLEHRYKVLLVKENCFKVLLFRFLYDFE